MGVHELLIHNIYLFLTDGAWVDKSFVFQI